MIWLSRVGLRRDHLEELPALRRVEGLLAARGASGRRRRRPPSASAARGRSSRSGRSSARRSPARPSGRGTRRRCPLRPCTATNESQRSHAADGDREASSSVPTCRARRRESARRAPPSRRSVSAAGRSQASLGRPPGDAAPRPGSRSGRRPSESTRKMPSPTASSTLAARSRSAATASAAASAASSRRRSAWRRAFRSAAPMSATRPSTISSCSGRELGSGGHHLDDADDLPLVLDRHHHRRLRRRRPFHGQLPERPLAVDVVERPAGLLDHFGDVVEDERLAAHDHAALHAAALAVQRERRERRDVEAVPVRPAVLGADQPVALVVRRHDDAVVRHDIGEQLVEAVVDPLLVERLSERARSIEQELARPSPSAPDPGRRSRDGNELEHPPALAAEEEAVAARFRHVRPVVADAHLIPPKRMLDP